MKLLGYAGLAIMLSSAAYAQDAVIVHHDDAPGVVIEHKSAPPAVIEHRSESKDCTSTTIHSQDEMTGSSKTVKKQDCD